MRAMSSKVLLRSGLVVILLQLGACLPSPSSRKPCGEELCGDALDNDCDGQIDESDAIDAPRWYFDADSDSFGGQKVFLKQCEQPPGYVLNADDCDESSADIRPDALEVCDGIDQDCDGEPDDGLPTATLYLDSDGDAYGDAKSPLDTCATELEGYVDNSDDCDDLHEQAYPGGEEIWYDGIDGDCLGGDDFDQDGDGHRSSDYEGTDCVDTNPDVHAWAMEHHNGIDDDCDGNVDWESLADADVKLRGERDGHYSGFALASVGDVEGDGDIDLLVGAPYYGDAKSPQIGAAYLLMGYKYYDMVLDEGAARYSGENAEDLAGYSVAGAGDFNNDGLDDLLIGAPQYGGGELLSAGMAYLVYGHWSSYGFLSLTDSALAWRGPVGSGLGRAVASAGDVNWDNVPDILIGAPGIGDETLSQGDVYLVWGSEYYVSGRYDIEEHAIARIRGDIVGAFGLSLSGAGDPNGDGYGDFAIGAPYYSEESETDIGAVYLFLGNVSGSLRSSDANIILTGETGNSWAGWTVASAGDVDHDGCDDLLVGALYADTKEHANAGKAYLVLCPEASANLRSADWIGEGTGFGFSTGNVAGLGDVNGDGIDDFAVGAIAANSPYAAVGAVYVVLGSESIGGAGPLDLDQADVVFKGEGADDHAATVAYAGDLNFDGFNEILIGAPNRDIAGSGDNYGMTYIIYGRAF